MKIRVVVVFVCVCFNLTYPCPYHLFGFVMTPCLRSSVRNFGCPCARDNQTSRRTTKKIWCSCPTDSHVRTTKNFVTWLSVGQPFIFPLIRTLLRRMEWYPAFCWHDRNISVSWSIFCRLSLAFKIKIIIKIVFWINQVPPTLLGISSLGACFK